MTDPVAYVVSYSFAGFQAVSPDTPLPAMEVDTQFQDIATSLDSLIVSIADVRRSDGNLQNATVSWDALTDDVKAKFDNLETRVVVGDIAPAAFAIQAEAEAVVAADRLMTPLGVGFALDAQRPRASQLQAQQGTNNDAVMSPLRVKEAMDAQRKLTDKNTAEAGSNNTEVMTPLRSAEAIAALRKAFTANSQLTWGIIAGGAHAQQTIVVADALIGDRVILGLPASGPDVGFVSDAWVSSNGIVTVRLTNITGGALTPYAGAATSFNVTAIRF